MYCSSFTCVCIDSNMYFQYIVRVCSVYALVALNIVILTRSYSHNKYEITT